MFPAESQHFPKNISKAAIKSKEIQKFEILAFSETNGSHKTSHFEKFLKFELRNGMKQ